nr:VWA domain-containing protein [bacterium]
VLNGSVINNSTVSGASRLLRPATPPIVGSSAPIVAPGPSNSGSLFSADEQAAFSQVRQLPPLQQASPAIVAPSSYTSSANIQNSNSSIGSGSSNQSKFDIGQALRLGAQVVNAINASSNNRSSSVAKTGQFSASGTASAASNVLKKSLAKPAFVSKFARPLTASELTVLSKYDVVIVLDKSGSMDERDCPGGMSRWDWCRDQMMSLTAQISSVFKNGITVALYSSDYDIFRNVDLGYVTRIFGENGPSGGTYTGKVMEAVFDDYFARRASNPATRKLLVQVVTDGDPSDKGALIAAISRASQMINSPGEITVNFLQIGHEEAGARTLAKLDTNMASEGAKFDIVRVEPFAAVEREGLPRALADAIN